MLECWVEQFKCLTIKWFYFPSQIHSSLIIKIPKGFYFTDVVSNHSYGLSPCVFAMNKSVTTGAVGLTGRSHLCNCPSRTAGHPTRREQQPRSGSVTPLYSQCRHSELWKHHTWIRLSAAIHTRASTTPLPRSSMAKHVPSVNLEIQSLINIYKPSAT